MLPRNQQNSNMNIQDIQNHQIFSRLASWIYDIEFPHSDCTALSDVRVRLQAAGLLRRLQRSGD